MIETSFELVLQVWKSKMASARKNLLTSTKCQFLSKTPWLLCANFNEEPAKAFSYFLRQFNQMSNNMN
jgi:hypothetical protein